MSCLCGSTYLSPSFTITINGEEYSFLHKEESFLRAEQVFSTISEHINDSFDSISINVPITLDHKIRVVLKNRSGEIIGSKYMGKTDQRTILDKINFDSCDLLVRNLNDRIILQIYSVCDFSADECCDKLPSSVTITPIISSFCVTPTTTTTTVAPTTTTTTTTCLPPPTGDPTLLTFFEGSNLTMSANDPSKGTGSYQWYAIFTNVGNQQLINLSNCSPNLASSFCNAFAGTANTANLSPSNILSTAYNGTYFCTVTYGCETSTVTVGTRNFLA